MNNTIVRQDKYKIKGSPVGAQNPQPFFRQPDLAAAMGKNFPEEKKYSFGRETGFRLLPWTKQDRYNRRLLDMEFPSIVMENDFLKAEFIPALGGRLMYLFDKKQNRDILYRNPLFRPVNLAIRDAWFSGGIEWNIGRLGHTTLTCEPLFAGVFNIQELTVLRFWEFERQSRLFWRIEFVLPKDSDVLYSYVRIENPDNQDKPLYWWTNAAVPQTPGVRIFSNCENVIFLLPGKEKTMDFGVLSGSRGESVLPGKDASYPVNFGYSNEYFFQNDGEKELFWEAAVYEDGYAYGEASTSPLKYRKMFCWGQGRGGRRWQEFLSEPGQEYLEVQAGLAPTQLHTSDIAAGSVVDWVQAFCAFQTGELSSKAVQSSEAVLSNEVALSSKVLLSHQKDYSAARAHTAACLSKHIGQEAMLAMLEQGRERKDINAKIISMGGGWGALERQLAAKSGREGPPGLIFADESIGAAQEPWVQLLKTGCLPARSVQSGPGSFVVDEAWEKLLRESPVRSDDWLSPYHLGVIYFERGDGGWAVSCWEESVKRQENAWAYRNLALAAAKSGDVPGALDYYRRSMKLPGGEDQSFAEEYIPLLLYAGKETEAQSELDAYIKRAGSLEALSVPLMDAAARLALKNNDDSLLDKIFSIEQAHIREGNNSMVEIWAQREAGRTASSDSETLPPKEIDFRMYF